MDMTREIGHVGGHQKGHKQGFFLFARRASGKWIPQDALPRVLYRYGGEKIMLPYLCAKRALPARIQADHKTSLRSSLWRGWLSRRALRCSGCSIDMAQGQNTFA